jgi:ankyrin repeat protein
MRFGITVLAMVIGVAIVFAYRSNQRAQRDLDLRVAAQEGDYEAVEALLANGASPSGKPNERAPVGIALESGHSDIALLLIQAGGAVPPDRLLQSAITAKDEKVVRELIQRGADPNRLLESGFTPLMLATEKSALNVVTRLLDSGAKLEARCPSGRFQGETALVRAVMSQKSSVVQHLLQRGANPNVEFGPGDAHTPLGIAASAADLESVRLLVKYGADPNFRAKGGYTAYQLADVKLKSVIRDPYGSLRFGARPPDPNRLRQIMEVLKAAGAAPLPGPETPNTPRNDREYRDFVRAMNYQNAIKESAKSPGDSVR